MKTEHKNAWVEALRSGDYIQGEEKLVDYADQYNDVSVDKYCCIGVLCRIALENDWFPSSFYGDPNSRDSWMYMSEYDEGFNEWSFLEDEELTAELKDAFGLRYESHSQLVKMNDSGEYTFSQIADHIEMLASIERL